MIKHGRRPLIAMTVLCALTAARVQSTALEQAPGGKTVTDVETEVHEDVWDQLKFWHKGTKMRVTNRDGAEIEGELVRATDDTLVLENNRLRKGQLQADAAASLRQPMTFARPDLQSMHAPAWAQPAAHRDRGFLYDVVDVGFGRTLGGLRLVWTRERKALVIRSDGPGFWLAVRVTNLLFGEPTRPFSRFPSAFVFTRRKNWDSPFSAIDNAKNEYSVRRVTVAGVSTDNYAPGEFSVHLLYIPAKELVGTIEQLHVIFQDYTTAGGGRTRRVFSIKNPQSLKKDFKNRDFDYLKNPVENSETLPVEARTFKSTRSRQ